MKNMLIVLVVALATACMLPNDVSAQTSSILRVDTERVPWPVDSLGNKGRNVIKWNLTPFLLWDKANFNFSYERILRSHSSVSVNAGYFRLPEFASLNLDSVDVTNDKSRNGFSVAFDYRRYFAKRNTRWAPDGAYWGVWTSYHQTYFDNELNALNSNGDYINVKTKGKFGIYAIGAEFGYQFLIGEHFTIDLVLVGAGFARYSFSVSLESDGEIGETEILDRIIEKLVEKIPGFDELIDTGELDGSGKLNTSAIGLRFMLQIGYRF
ncbi:MAG: hypothetical protein DRI69_05340 [Bacteroidetes bacterium]|nr:MAG: hypothetical protein DRI69_05340 [Bacteroidota bacterium]